jgi:fluoride ion exporter CrcB/FEX
VLEVDGGRTGTAIAYLLVSVVGGVAAAAAGFALGRAVA